MSKIPASEIQRGDTFLQPDGNTESVATRVIIHADAVSVTIYWNWSGKERYRRYAPLDLIMVVNR
jgi:hypothetical protein